MYSMGFNANIKTRGFKMVSLKKFFVALVTLLMPKQQPVVTYNSLRYANYTQKRVYKI